MDGNTLFNKIAVLSQEIREHLPNSGLINQLIKITVTAECSLLEEEPAADSFLYALRLADSIQLQFNDNGWTLQNNAIN